MAALMPIPPLFAVLGLLVLAAAIALLAFFGPSIEAHLLCWLLRRRTHRETRHQQGPRMALRGYR